MTIAAHFSAILPAEGILTEAADLERYGRDWCRDFAPNPGPILLPQNSAQVQEIMKVCQREHLAVVPSGGRTGLSGGATATKGEIILSLERLKNILHVDRIARTLTCEAGTVTQRIQEAAAEAGFFFPIDFSSKGSSQIGGNVATNAGGIRVIRYGNTRDWVLGLKVVLPGGELLDLNGALFKNQTGYDLRNLIIGSEGTLAVVVEVTLKLADPPQDVSRALCSLATVPHVLELLDATRCAFPTLSVFEYFSQRALAPALAHGKLAAPLKTLGPHYALIEIERGSMESSEGFEEHCMAMIERGLVTDAVVAQTRTQADLLLRYRELIPETLSTHLSPHKNDISLPIAAIPEFLKELDTLIAVRYPGIEVVIFGHIGDGNLHVNVLKPSTCAQADFFKQCHEVDGEVFALVQRFRGSISAEHGVGLLKKDFLHFSRSANEIALMRSIKRAFDPHNILNPGKIFDL